MCGGAFLSYEGAHKIVHALKGDDHEHAVPSAALGPEAGKSTIAWAIRTDLILSAEIMVISLKEVIDEPLVSRAVILVVVAFLITVVVYGVVAGIVKMDDVGLSLTQRASARAQAIGRRLVTAMPVLLAALSKIGIAAMLWVGGHILLVGAPELGWDAPSDLRHDLEGLGHDAGRGRGVPARLVQPGASTGNGLGGGLSLTPRASARAQAIGRRLVTAMPVLLAALSKIGIAAMLWVGGHILLVGAHELGWDAPYDIVHDLEGLVDDAGGASGVLTWLVNTAASAVIGLAVGLLVTTIVARFTKGGDAPEPHPA